MKRYLWAIIAGVCVVALVVAGAILIPRLFTSTHAKVEDVELIPGHWWKADLTEEQLSTLAALWGEDITVAQLLQALWPEALQEMPQEAATAYERQQPGWPTETYEKWETRIICRASSVSSDGGPILCCIYVGGQEFEDPTFVTAGDRGFTEDGTYRVSIYTGISLG